MFFSCVVDIKCCVNLLTYYIANVVDPTYLTALVNMIPDKCPAVVCLSLNSKVRQSIVDSPCKWPSFHSEVLWHVGLSFVYLYRYI